MTLRKKKKTAGRFETSCWNELPMFLFKLFASFTAIQGLNFIIWDKLTIQKDPKIMFRESLERRPVYQIGCCLHFCFFENLVLKGSWKDLWGWEELSSLMPRECQSGSSSVAWHLHSCWVYEPSSYGRLLFVFNEWHKALELMNSVSVKGWLDDKECPAALNGISWLWSGSSIYSKKKHVSKEDCVKYLWTILHGLASRF